MNKKIEKLIKLFARLPRVGNRAATRIVLSLLNDKSGKAHALAQNLMDVAETIHPCPNCGVLTDGDLCDFCRDSSRANGALCVVRDMGDVWTFEKASVFHGRYHIIGGVLSGSYGVTPTDLNIQTLQDRIKNENITEVIFALPNTMEGKTTANYIMYILGDNTGAVFSELASGVPLGGDLDYIDDGTLTLAFGGRKKL